MFEKLIRFSIEQRWLVLLAALAMGALGVFNYQKLPLTPSRTSPSPTAHREAETAKAHRG